MTDGVAPSPLPRIGTGVPGLDAILDGGLVAGAACLVVGPPGSGKTTLGNQVAFHHARGGGNVLFATVLAESHERMLRRLTTFRFFDPALVGTRLHYLNLLDTLDEEGLDGLLAVLRREIRNRDATLLVVDGIALIEEFAPSAIEFRRFVNRLQATTALSGCTTLLLGSAAEAEGAPTGNQTDGLIAFALQPAGVRDQRALRVVKFRGTQHLMGRHDIAIGAEGIAVYPRLESRVGQRRTAWLPGERMSTGSAGLDHMLGGGLFPWTSTLLMGTPGSGKTITGLHFIAAGVPKGERGMIATFHETAEGLANTTTVGGEVARGVADDLIDVFWTAPLESSPDAWAWELLDRVERHRPRRLFIDGLSDVHRMHLFPERMPLFLTALFNELRSRGVTSLATVEIDAYVRSELVAPVPAISAMVDNSITLRHVELRSRLRRLVSVLKARQSDIDPEIREFVIRAGGVEVGEPFVGAAALLTGAALPDVQAEAGLRSIRAPS